MTIEELVGAGFCLVATWQRDESGQGVYKEKKKLPEEPGLYPFVEQRGPVVRHNMSLNAEISFFGLSEPPPI